MPRDFADRAMMRRNSHGALVSRMPASGSSLPGGSPITIGMRKRLNRARQTGRAIIVRDADATCMRVATFNEIIRAHKSYDGRILIPDVLGADGDFGALCRVMTWPAPITHTSRFDPRPRLVKHTTHNRHRGK